MHTTTTKNTTIANNTTNVTNTPTTPGAKMAVTAVSNLQQADIVSWTLSGEYNELKPVLIDAGDPTRSISKDRAVRLIASLVGAFRADSTVCLHLPNDILYPVLALAVWASGCRWTGTNVAYTAVELEHHFRISEAKYVITTEDQLEKICTAVACSDTNAEIIIFTDILSELLTPPGYGVGDDEPKNYRNLHDLQHRRSARTLYSMICGIDPDSIAALMSTSGTTGSPKMAARTHRAMVCESAAIAENDGEKDYAVRRLYCTPVFHAFSAAEMIINALRLGRRSYFMNRFNIVKFPEMIQDFGITETFAPPALLLQLVNQTEAHDLIQPLRAVYTGGSTLVPELRSKFLHLFKTEQPRIVQVWGMTEGGWYSTFKYPEVDITGSVGRAIPGCEIKVAPTDMLKISGESRVGEVLVRGPNMMSGYYRNITATEDAFEDGWLKTGDIGYVDHGKIYLVDRAKDLIKVNSWQVSPAEIENALLVSSHVRDVGVIGIGSDVDEHPLAFIVLAKDSYGVTAESLRQHLLQRLTRYKVSRCEMRFVDFVPRSAAGKILKNELRKMVTGP